MGPSNGVMTGIGVGRTAGSVPLFDHEPQAGLESDGPYPGIPMVVALGIIVLDDLVSGLDTARWADHIHFKLRQCQQKTSA